jgi:hypothetical protein
MISDSEQDYTPIYLSYNQNCPKIGHGNVKQILLQIQLPTWICATLIYKNLWTKYTNYS